MRANKSHFKSKTEPKSVTFPCLDVVIPEDFSLHTSCFNINCYLLPDSDGVLQVGVFPLRTSESGAVDEAITEILEKTLSRKDAELVAVKIREMLGQNFGFFTRGNTKEGIKKRKLHRRQAAKQKG